MKNFRLFGQLVPKYFQKLLILRIPMTASRKTHQNISDYNQFFLKKKDLKLIKKTEFFL